MSLIIEVEGVRIAYESEPVLDGLSLRVRPGEWLGILGPNGSGKTTLLRAISGYLPARAGHVLIDGRPLAAYTPGERARRMAAVGAELPTEVPLRVLEYVALGRTPHLGGWGREGPRDWQIIGQAMERAGVTALAERPLSRLSAGERQKVMIARALAQEPRILLVDEPTSHLDIRHQMDIMDLFADLRARLGLTLIAVLHDINLASLYCDRLVLLREGRVFAAGEPACVITAECIRQVYGCDVLVQPHPTAGVPQVMLMRTGRAGTPRQDGRATATGAGVAGAG
ncbi:MAG TPA: ABC transporter ATP-binding protein [Thermaerobacter sp.]